MNKIWCLLMFLHVSYSLQNNMLEHYISSVQDYWSEFEFALNYKLGNMDNTEDLKCPSYIRSAGYDLGPCSQANLTQVQYSHMTRYLEKYVELYPLLEHFREDFNNRIDTIIKIDGDTNYSLDYIIDLYMMVARLRCGRYPTQMNLLAHPYKKLIETYDISISLQVDGKGVFSIHEFILAFRHKIMLLGVPSGFAIYDTYLGCPSEFLDHDVLHLKSIITRIFKTNSDYKLSSIYSFYDRIGHDKSLDESEYSSLIFTLFYLIHESTVYFTDDDLTCSGNRDKLRQSLDYEIHRFETVNPIRPPRVEHFYTPSQRFVSFKSNMDFFYEYVGRM